MSGLILSVFAVLLAAPAPPDVPDEKLLQGEWRVVEADCDARDFAKRWTGVTASVRGNRIQWRFRQNGTGESTFVLDPRKDPKEIDIYHRGADDPGVPFKGIYAIEKDRLRLFWRLIPGRPRPRTFERRDEGAEWEWLILERVPKK